MSPMAKYWNDCEKKQIDIQRMDCIQILLKVFSGIHMYHMTSVPSNFLSYSAQVYNYPAYTLVFAHELVSIHPAGFYPSK